MDIGFVGLGRMGFNMALRLRRAGHRVSGTDRGAEALARAAAEGIATAPTPEALIAALPAPRVLWAMIPAGDAVDELLDRLLPALAPGDLVVDGGNSNFKDSRRRAARLAEAGLGFVDCGTSGGVWGLANGYCMMLGGAPDHVARLAPLLDDLAPPDGWKHVGPPGAGHYVKMIHNGIEYGMMQAYAEGFEILAASDFGFDLAGIAALWNRGSVVRSWLLELAGRAFEKDPRLEGIRGWVADSGEGRWTVLEALERDVPAEVLTLALLNRFRSRQTDSFRDRVLAALRNEFGGHAVKER
uniref:Decarboxylating 6-phosphogluconate dehydrogenase n=1 Tax=Eiseniibacteriota bacterium TaxID=2212470 RepID=A0A832I3H3_UNCEI